MDWFTSLNPTKSDLILSAAVAVSTVCWYFVGRMAGYRHGRKNAIKFVWGILQTVIKLDLSGQARDFLNLCKDVSISGGPSPAQMIELLKLGNGMIDDAQLFLEKQTGIKLSSADTKEMFDKKIKSVQVGSGGFKSTADDDAPQVVKDIGKAMNEFMQKASAEGLSPDDIASGLMGVIENVGGDQVEATVRVRKKNKDDFNGPLTEV